MTPGPAGATEGDAGDFDTMTYVVHSIGAFVEFLVETGRWSGSAEQLAAVMDFLDTTGEDDGGGGFVDVPDIPDEEALAAFSGLPLIRRATALLQWIGEGKPVTATGALRLRDIEAAAACVGVAVKGGTKGSGSPLPGTAGPDGPVPTVRSMYEVPLLAQLWNALEAAELIEITSTKVVPSADSGVFLAGGPSERLAELVFFVDQFLETAVLGIGSGAAVGTDALGTAGIAPARGGNCGPAGEGADPRGPGPRAACGTGHGRAS